MSRLINFLTEASGKIISTNPLEIYNLINTNCQPFLSEKVPFYKGYFNSEIDRSVKFSLEEFGKVTNRRPQATDGNLYSFVNNWLRKHGFVSRASSVIVSTDIGTTKTFGYPHILFPVGNFKYTYCKSEDFNIPTNQPFKIDYFKQLFNEKENVKYGFGFRVKEPVDNPEQKILETISNINLKEAQTNNWEIWFKADKSYSLYCKNPKMIGQAISSGKFKEKLFK